jgi:phosphoribosylglycinamide formyltransferase-1
MSVAIAVFVSGSGSNLQALIDDAKKQGTYHVACVIASNTHCFALERAQNAGIPAYTMVRKEYADQASYDATMQSILVQHDVEWVCLAGFMRLLSPEFVALWENKILNIHPSLLPAFKGKDAVADALDAGVQVTGCTVHLVTAALDDGPILVQGVLPLLPGDTADSLRERLHPLEHRCYVYALNGLLRGDIWLEAGRVKTRLPSLCLML